MSHHSPSKVSRRKFLKTGLMSGAALCLPGCVVKRPNFAKTMPAAPVDRKSLRINDIHSQLNATLVDAIATPGSIDECQGILRAARREGKTISVAGGRHSMGGQQFADDSLLIDT